MGDQVPFRDRKEAGRLLALKLKQYAHNPDVLVLGLPRGGVPVAAEVASALAAPLDVFIVRKLVLPGFKSEAFGAIASGGVSVLNTAIVEELGIPDVALEAVQERELRELRRQEQAYRGENEPPVSVVGRTVILVDDGMATGWSIRAAIAALRPRRPARIVLAMPVAAPGCLRELADEADEVVCLETPERVASVGESYLDFRPVTEEEVRNILESSECRVPVHVS
jgi:predicted phosphoribosyltransferase